MTSGLDPDLLKQGLGTLRGALPRSLDAAVLAQWNLQADRLAADADRLNPPPYRLPEFLSPVRHMLTEEALSLLGGTAFHVVPVVHPNAFSTVVEGERKIILFVGLIDSIGYRLAATALVDALPDALFELHPFANLPDTSAGAALATLLDILFLDLMRNGCFAPALTGLFDEDTQARLQAQRILALGFCVAHELAHFDLGHFSLGDDPVRPAFDQLLLAETVSPFQQEEFDADSRAIAFFKDEARPTVPDMAGFLFRSLSTFEYLFEERSASHPLSLNRLDRLRAAVPGPGDAEGGSGHGGLAGLLDGYRRNDRAKEDARTRFGDHMYTMRYETPVVFETLRELNVLLRGTSFDLGGVLDTCEQQWRISPATLRERTQREMFRIDPDRLPGR